MSRVEIAKLDRRASKIKVSAWVAPPRIFYNSKVGQGIKLAASNHSLMGVLEHS